VKNKASAQPPDTGEEEKRPSGLREYSSSVVIAIGLALLIRSTVVQAFYIPSGSMEDTLDLGDYLLANKFVYGAPLEVPLVDDPVLRLPALRDPQPGDIVIFRSKDEAPQQRRLFGFITYRSYKDLIKRCVAVGGQTVEIRNKVLHVDGVPFPDPHEAKYADPLVYAASGSPRDNYGPLTVPADHFFMMGDNRDNSRDSRYFGAVPRRLIKGKAMIIYWSAELKQAPRWIARRGLPQLMVDLGSFVWHLPTLPFRTRYTRLGEVIH